MPHCAKAAQVGRPFAFYGEELNEYQDLHEYTLYGIFKKILLPMVNTPSHKKPPSKANMTTSKRTTRLRAIPGPHGASTVPHPMLDICIALAYGELTGAEKQQAQAKVARNKKYQKLLAGVRADKRYYGFTNGRDHRRQWTYEMRFINRLIARVDKELGVR